jgi:hypothetical protein
MREYRDQELHEKPLSFGVFGAPGSGKSFGIIEVAKSIFGGKFPKLEFNLSQWNDPQQLHHAFQDVRDARISGGLPLVFWDEFDTGLNGERLGWLRHFLAPMQDGKFYDGHAFHQIGRCIFVFAGGTSASMREFVADLKSENARNAKLPDFASRLKGFVNIRGPNPHESASGTGDRYFVLRRAILLRALLTKYAPQLFQTIDGRAMLSIDPGILRAFLLTKEYRHGARSMEAVVAMSLLAGHMKFERSSLPTEEQLEIHVDGADFLALVHLSELEGAMLEELAEAAHRDYRENRERDGWRFGPTRDNARKLHPLLVDYSQLSELYKDSNRRLVRTIPRKLARAGYIMIPVEGTPLPAVPTEEEVEKMARCEHELWMQERTTEGYRPGAVTSEKDLTHEHIKPWDELSEDIKEIDRDLVRGIPELLRRAGYGLAKVQ